MRYFLVDKVTELVVGERATGIKNVTLSDDVLHDHFPDYPIMPGALIVESSAQLAGFLLEMGQEPMENGTVRRALLVQIDKAKFHGLAGPGDQLEIQVSITSRTQTAARVRAEVSASHRRIARADLTFSMKCIEVDAIHEQRRKVYQVWTRDLDLSVPIR